jgi:ribosome-associated toxin RatA of RatAB toxin-antitoxin module
MQRDKMLEMQLLEGPFSHLQGFWQFMVLAENASKITLDLEFEVSNRIVGLALTPVFSNIANQLVDRFHQRAADLYGQPA